MHLYAEIVVLNKDLDTDIEISEIMEDISVTMSKTFSGLDVEEELLVRVNTVIDGKIVSSVSKILKT